MDLEIVEAFNWRGEKVGVYEVGEYLTWKERLKQVKAGKNEEVYCLWENVRTFNHGLGCVSSWFSITKVSWEKCRKIIRRIK